MSRKKIRKRKPTINRKLNRSISIIVLIFLVGIIFASYKSIDIIYMLNAGVISWQGADEVDALYSSTNLDDFTKNLDNIEQTHEVKIEIFNKNGKLVYSTAYNGVQGSPPYDDADAIPDEYIRHYTTTDIDTYNTNNGYHFETQRDEETGIDYLVFVKTAASGDTIKVYKQKSAFDQSAKLAFIFISVLCTVSLFAIMLTTFTYLRKFTKPLIKMNNVTKRIANLDFSQKCPQSNILEISQLAESINEMSDSLENSLIDIRNKNEKLQKDIENERTIDQLREVFISGISHELKTPIEIIQGFAEGLEYDLDNDPEMAKKYCRTIIDETGRMNDLTMKLLDITKYESGAYQLMYENFNLKQLIGEWFDRNSKILKDKGISTSNKINESFIARGDSFILSTVVNNYLSNAVSHVKNENIISASAEDFGDKYRVYIYNTGDNIAQKDIDKIWNSFCRADKSLSRSQGRFGLGLAIVAAIQKLHGHAYGVENMPDGVRFWFDVSKGEKENDENFAEEKP